MPQPTLHAKLDEQVSATLAQTTLGRPVVMTPAQIGRHIGVASDTSWGPSAQAVSAALRRLEAAGRVTHTDDGWAATR